jgi:FKBP-type peptidyl-prolyl cis-trans isomerase
MVSVYSSNWLFICLQIIGQKPKSGQRVSVHYTGEREGEMKRGVK